MRSQESLMVRGEAALARQRATLSRIAQTSSLYPLAKALTSTLETTVGTLERNTALVGRLKAEFVRQLRLDLLREYQRRGQLIMLARNSAAVRAHGISPQDEWLYVQLHRRWTDFRMAECWNMRRGGQTPDSVIEALVLVGIWEQHGRPDQDMAIRSV